MITFYTKKEIEDLGYTLDDCVPREIKGCIFYIFKKDLQPK